MANTMTASDVASSGDDEAIAARSSRRRRKSRPYFSFLIMAVFLISALLAPLLAPHNPHGVDIGTSRIPPFKSMSHLLGTDLLGRDVLSRMIYGARSDVVIALFGLGLSMVVGVAIGIVSGYVGGWIDRVCMRLTDIALSFPTVLVALVVSVFMGPGVSTLLVAVVITMWCKFARMVRGDVLTIRERHFVTSARISGVRTPVVLVRHILPNLVSTLSVLTSVLIGQVILLEASLSYLGVGLAPGAPSWGLMVSEGQSVLVSVWWLSLFPGIAITLVVMATSFIGDWLREALDPRLQVL